MFILKWIKAKKNGIPLYIKDKWYNYRAMMTESEAKTTDHIQIYDDNGKYIVPKRGVTVNVFFSKKKVIATYVIIGIHEESRNKDWLYAYDLVNRRFIFRRKYKKDMRKEISHERKGNKKNVF